MSRQRRKNTLSSKASSSLCPFTPQRQMLVGHSDLSASHLQEKPEASVCDSRAANKGKSISANIRKNPVGRKIRGCLAPRDICNTIEHVQIPPCQHGKRHLCELTDIQGFRFLNIPQVSIPLLLLGVISFFLIKCLS